MENKINSDEDKYLHGGRYVGPLIPNANGQKINIDFLIIGHPRSGTGYISKLFDSYGIKIGHESIGKHGISCWTFVTPNCNYLRGAPNSERKSINGISRQDLKYNHLVHIVRNPFDVINSIYFTESKTRSQFFRLLHATPKITDDLDIRNKSHKDKLTDIILSVIRWNNMISDLKPNAVFKIENCEERVVEYLKSNNFKIQTENTFKDKEYNTRKKQSKDKLTPTDYDIIDGAVLTELKTYCKKHKYEYLQWI